MYLDKERIKCGTRHSQMLGLLYYSRIIGYSPYEIERKNKVTSILTLLNKTSSRLNKTLYTNYFICI